MELTQMALSRMMSKTLEADGCVTESHLHITHRKEGPGLKTQMAAAIWRSQTQKDWGVLLGETDLFTLL